MYSVQRKLINQSIIFTDKTIPYVYVCMLLISYKYRFLSHSIQSDLWCKNIIFHIGIFHHSSLKCVFTRNFLFTFQRMNDLSLFIWRIEFKPQFVWNQTFQVCLNYRCEHKKCKLRILTFWLSVNDPGRKSVVSNWIHFIKNETMKNVLDDDKIVFGDIVSKFPVNVHSY